MRVLLIIHRLLVSVFNVAYFSCTVIRVLTLLRCRVVLYCCSCSSPHSSAYVSCGFVFLVVLLMLLLRLAMLSLWWLCFMCVLCCSVVVCCCCCFWWCCCDGYCSRVCFLLLCLMCVGWLVLMSVFFIRLPLSHIHVHAFTGTHTRLHTRARTHAHTRTHSRAHTCARSRTRATTHGLQSTPSTEELYSSLS